MNPLIGNLGSPTSSTPNVANIMRILKNGNSEQIAMTLLQTDPRFAEFMRQNQGKNPEQVAREHGIDLDQLVRMF